VRNIAPFGRRLAALWLSLWLAAPVLAGPLEDGLQAAKDKDWKRAFELWKPLADAGNPKAQFYIAGQYERGLGVERDEKVSLEWLRKSAEGGLALAQFNYGNNHYALKSEEGFRNAVKWWGLAAEKGFFPAQYNLAMAYQEGLGVKKDLDKAAHWYQQAAENGSEPAKAALAKLQEKSGKGKAAAAPAPTNAAKGEPTPAAKKEPGPAAATAPPATPPPPGTLANTNVAGTPPMGESAASLPLAAEAGSAGGIDWIKAQPGGNHTLQLASTANAEEAQAMAGRWSGHGTVAVFPFRKEGALWYSVILGSYTSPAQARLESKRLQEIIKREPWVRRFDGIQAAIAAP
jgi:TPR repeat protein